VDLHLTDREAAAVAYGLGVAARYQHRLGMFGFSGSQGADERQKLILGVLNRLTGETEPQILKTEERNT